MTEELYKKHRPARLKDVIGQDDAVRQLADWGRRGAVPHFLLFAGPSGVGKTTVARILRTKLGCGNTDYTEVNAANARGIDMVRGIQSNLMMAPISGKCRFWTIDECHRLTGEAQDSFLKMLEDTPDHVYFVLSTTNPQKLLKTIITRATELKFRLLSYKDLEQVISSVLEAECLKPLSRDVMDRLVDAAEGSARKALVLLHAIIGLSEEDEQLDAIAKGDHKAQAIELARLLMKPGVSWPEVAKLLKNVDEEHESLRRMVLGYCRTMLLSGGKGVRRAAAVIDRFQDALYESGAAGLALACYDIVCPEDGK